MGNKWLADAISYKEDIEPYQFIKIFSGVGSGKNTFIDKLVNGYTSTCRDGSEYEVERKYVLQITSRRAKVNEQLESNEVVYDPRVGLFDQSSNAVLWLDEKYDDYYESPTIELPHLGGWGTQRVYKRSCACTNAKIGQYIKYQYNPLDLATHPWERFDMIVIDEVHSLLADASYQSAPFYVRQLIKETLKHSKVCKVIVMTGTPDLLLNDPLFEGAHELNLMKECVNLTPSRLVYVDSMQAKDRYLSMLKDKEKAVYFANHISRIMMLLKEAPEELLDCIAVSFSNQSKINMLKEKYSKVYENMCTATQMIAQEMKLPDELVMFLTTSKNKEGINIKNGDIKTMFIEAHTSHDVLQMAGRLRLGIETLYLVVDSPPFPKLEHSFEMPFSRDSAILETVNAYLEEIKSEAGTCDSSEDDPPKRLQTSERICSFISFIEDRFPYLKYDYFTDCFMYYSEREFSLEHQSQQYTLFENTKTSKAELIRLADMWFPGIQCEVQCATTVGDQQAVNAYLERNNWLDGLRTIQGAERDEILAAINHLTGKNGYQLKSLLKSYGFDMELDGKKRSSKAVIRRIE